MLIIENLFPLKNLIFLWPIDTKLGVWVAYVKRQFEIATQVSVIEVKVSVTKNQFLFYNLNYLWPIGTRHGFWVPYIKRQLANAT